MQFCRKGRQEIIGACMLCFFMGLMGVWVLTETYNEIPTTRQMIRLTVVAVIILIGFVLMVIAIIKKPDFDYYVSTTKKWIMFCMDEDEDVRRMKRTFDITEINDKYLIMRDTKGTTLKIAYSQEVLDFLKKVRVEPR